MLARSEVPVVATTPRTRRILVVDDDAGIRALCGSVLRSAGFEVIEAGDGREGLARAVSGRPDLVLCDITMPILDGFGLAVALRHNEQTKHLPLVFMTGETEPTMEQHAYEVGALGFLSKPFAAHALSSFISGVLAQLAPAVSPSLGGHAI